MQKGRAGKKKEGTCGVVLDSGVRLRAGVCFVVFLVSVNGIKEREDLREENLTRSG